jgi:hypothetical protein
MDATGSTGAGESFERHEDTVEGESMHAEGGVHTEDISPRGRRLNVTTLASTAFALAVGAEFLRQNPQVRQACRSVVQDPEVHQACREAADGVLRAVTASWRRHDGMTALAAAFPRL